MPHSWDKNYVSGIYTRYTKLAQGHTNTEHQTKPNLYTTLKSIIPTTRTSATSKPSKIRQKSSKIVQKSSKSVRCPNSPRTSSKNVQNRPTPSQLTTKKPFFKYFLLIYLPIELLPQFLREVGLGAEDADGVLHVLRERGGRLEAGVEHERPLGGLDRHLRPMPKGTQNFQQNV